MCIRILGEDRDLQLEHAESLVSPDGVFKSDGIELSRIDSNTKGRGKNKFTDMTEHVRVYWKVEASS